MAGDDDDNKIITFPMTAEERKKLRKAKQDLERQKLVNLFIDEAGSDALFTSRDGTAFADLIVAGHRETWPIRSKQFRYEYIRYLKRQQERLTMEGALLALELGLSQKKSAINHAIDDFEMRAIGSRVTREVHVRIAADGDNIFIDLGDPDWHAVRVTALSWSIVQSPPVRFRRSNGMLALPFPERGVAIEQLRPFLNVKTDDDFTLAVAWLLAALRPFGPYVILVLIGEHGAAKTMFLRLLRSLIDPSEAATTALPFSGRDLFIAAYNARVLMFENVSKLSDLMSDHLCRLATGGAVRLRAMYKDVDETLLRAIRPIAMEGIADFAVRPDLRDRAIILDLETLAGGRRDERAMLAEFDRVRPGLLGALLDRLVVGIRQLPDTHVDDLPRMADFTLWGAACGLADFPQAYAANRQAAIGTVLEHSELADAIQALMTGRHQWSGTASELLDQLGDVSRVTNAKVLSDELTRIAPMLRSIGIDMRRTRSNTKRKITIIRQS